MTDWNDKIMAEFRANDGVVGGPFAGAKLLLLGTTGAKSGAARIAPVVYFVDGGAVHVVASKAGAPESPAWYHNLVAEPRVHVEQATDDGIRSYDAVAEPLDRTTRDAVFERISAVSPGFAEYQRKTDRVIPIVKLTPA